MARGHARIAPVDIQGAGTRPRSRIGRGQVSRENRISAATLQGGVPSTARFTTILESGPLPDAPPTTRSRHWRARTPPWSRQDGDGTDERTLPDAHRQVAVWSNRVRAAALWLPETGPRDRSTLRRFSGPIAAKLRYLADDPRHPILELGAAAAKCGVGGAFVARAIELRITNEPLLASRRQRQRLVSARETSRPRRRCSDPGPRCSRSYYPNTERRFGRGGRSSQVPSRRTVRGR
jgi:hypothetical protein